MKPAVIMMFRDEADILGKCLEHWYALGVRDFYLCDNGSADGSALCVNDFYTRNRHEDELRVHCQSDTATDWPGRRVINDLKNRALADGCDWIFPADADEFLVLPNEFNTVQDWLCGFHAKTGDWHELPYLNILPDGRKEWQNPQMKCFGLFTPGMVVSMGNHIIEGIEPAEKLMQWNESSAHYRHYSLRTYPQFRKKMQNYMTAFSQNGFSDHHHAESFRRWQVEGEAYLQNLWTELTNTPCSE